MSRVGKFRETLALYRKHGWRLARVLMTAEALAELRAGAGGAGEAGDTGGAEGGARFEGAEAREAGVDAMWFARASQGGREAWELRLIGEPYALFEMFEADEEEEDREDVRREMEARLRERVAPSAAGEGVDGGGGDAARPGEDV